jgi:hypothetical protein
MKGIGMVAALALLVVRELGADQASDAAFARAVGTKPEFTLRAGDRIVGVVGRPPGAEGGCYRVVALKAAGASWSKAAERPLVDDDEASCSVLDAFSSADVGGKPYLYVALEETREGTANAGSVTIEFILVDVQTLEPLGLAYWGEERGSGTVEGKLVTPETLARRPELLAFLKRKADASPRIYRGERDSMSWVDDWKKLNGSLPGLIERPSFGPVKIRWQYYDQDPMAGHSTADDKEDRDFKVMSYFRSSLIGFDKARKRYFPIWVESCNHGCNKEIRDLKQGVVSFVYSEWDTQEKVVYVDLKAGTVRMVVEPEGDR